MTMGGSTMCFTYGINGHPVSLNYDGIVYYYVTNAQGDVVAILNSSGQEVVSYTYDAWGNTVKRSGSKADTLGLHNPLRYRSYVYDQETGLYYLQSRYYNPTICRFISADALLGANQSANSYNLFVYCRNNPIMFVDQSGYAPEWWQWIVSGAITIVGVAFIATGFGGIWGGALVCAGVNSIIGSYTSEESGGSSEAGWLGGLATGLACGLGAGVSGGFLLKAAESVGAACINNLVASFVTSFGSGFIGSVAGQSITASLNGQNVNINQLMTSSLLVGTVNSLSGIGAGIGAGLQGMPSISTTSTILANSLTAVWSLISESVCDFLGTVFSIWP